MYLFINLKETLNLNRYFSNINHLCIIITNTYLLTLFGFFYIHMYSIEDSSIIMNIS